MKKFNKLISFLLALAMVFSILPMSIVSAEEEEETTGAPAATDIGYPTFKNTELLDDVYDLEALGVTYGEDDLMMAIYQQDLANGGDSFYFDRILAREGVANGNANENGNNDGNTFMTRGRALYMYTSYPSIIGFGGSTAYHQPLGSGTMYAINFYSGDSNLRATEDTAKRVNYPSNWVSSYTLGTDLAADVTKFINNENVAVTAITVTNNGESEITFTAKASSNYVSDTSTVTIGDTVADELVGTVMSPSNLTTITTRLTGNGFVASESGASIDREVTLAAGESVELKVVMAFTTEELPSSTEDYIRLAGLSNLEAIRAQKAEYNLYWAENVPYIDIPNKAVQKAIDYRWWLERFNMLDANIPGYDYQYPVTIEGVLGYNNAIVLTQSMHMQDTKWLRSPYLVYGAILSVGNSSQSSAFLDNPGNRNNWNNHYGQYIAEAGLEAFNVIGGGAEVAENFAYYFGHDATGQLEHYGNHIEGRDLIAYRNAYMTGNDADTISFHAPGVGTYKVHGENAYVWAAADAAAKLYTELGDTEQATYYRELADKIQADVLDLLWCEECQKFETYSVSTTSAQHNAEQPNLVKYTESNNYNYFSVGLVPTDEVSIAKYKEALKAFSNGEEFPIFPFYTANQVHNAEVPGSNNFSNINFTVQLRAYEAALRTYDKEQEYVTDEMLGMMAEWMAWNVYPDAGDIRYPNNNEFHNIDGATYDDYYRSWIYHNILGNYIYLFIEDMAGVQPRADELIELSPIGFDYDHFMVNNIRYHGHDLTITWDKPNDGTVYYADRPEGYSLYIDGELAFTLAELGHAIYDPTTKTFEFPDGEIEVITNNGGNAITTAMETAITDERTLELLEIAGIHGMTNLAEGATVTASYTPDTARSASWAEKHRADGSDATSEAVNETVPDPQAVTDGTTVNMPFWGNYGTRNSKDTLILDLGETKTVDMATLYFYNDRQSGGYSEPDKYTIEYWDGEAWQHVQKQNRLYGTPRANYNAVYFQAVETSQFRFTFINKDNGYTAVTEIQLFNEGGERTDPPANTAPTVSLSEDASQSGNLHTGLTATIVDDGLPYEGEMTYLWEVVTAPEGAEIIMSSANKPSTTINGSIAGDYTLRLTVSDGELSVSGEITVTLVKAAAGGLGKDVGPDAATVESDYTSSWEYLNGINNPDFEPSSSNVGTGKGWGNWSQSAGSEHYVGYVWNEAVTIGGSDIYWYDDGGGTRIPASLRMQYKDESGEWQDVKILTPFESSVALNQYNRVMFEPVTTTALRLYVTVRSDAAANGIYRFKVYESVDVESLDEVYIATKTGVMPALPATVTGRTAEGGTVNVSVVWDTLTEEMIANDATITLKGVNTATGMMTTATIYVRSDMDKAIITYVDAIERTTDLGVVPSLPKTVKVGYNNGAYDNQNIVIVWPELSYKDFMPKGDHRIEGVIEGTTTTAVALVHVLADEEVEAVEGLINAIGEVTTESKEAIDAAWNAYKVLSERKKLLVTNYETLIAAIKAYKELTPSESTTLIAMSDYQGSKKAGIPTAITDQMLEAGVDAELALFLGDYVDGSVYSDGSNTSQSEMMTEFGKLLTMLRNQWPLAEYLAIQGNHDYSGFVEDGTLNATGAYEYEDYIVYLINEDDFPWWQAGYASYSDGEACKAAVEKTAADLDTYLQSLIDAGDTRPVIIGTHVPMHWSPRSTTGQGWWNDNIHANILFNVINEAGTKLDIVFLFGHNHSSYTGTTNGTYYQGYDQDIGGAMAYVGRGETMRVPNGTTGTNNFTLETLSFTYMNAGYIGNYNGKTDDCTISAITITDETIEIDRYGTDGLREENCYSITRGDHPALLTVKSADDITGDRSQGTSETFVATLTGAEATSYTWTCDETLATISGADTATATVTYIGAGDVTINCTVTYLDGDGQTQSLNEDVTVTVVEVEEPDVPAPTTTYEQVTDLTEINAEDEYLIVAWRYFGGSNDDSTNGYVFQAENNGDIRALTEDEYATVTGEFTENCLWKLTYADGKITLQNVGTGKYLADSIPAASDEAYELNIASGTVSGYSNFAIGTDSKSIRFSGSSNSFSFGGGAPANMAVATNACNLTIYKVVTKTEEPDVPAPATTYEQVTDLTEINAEDEYLIAAWRYFGGTNEDSTNGYVFQAENNGDIRALTEDSYQTVTGEFTENCLWKLTYADGKITLQNVGTGKYLADSIPAASDEAYELNIASGTVNGYSNFAIGTDSKSIRFSGSSNSFSFGGGAPADMASATNACNLTIYKVVVMPQEPVGDPAVKAVEDLIAAIGEVTLDSEAAIRDARAAYDALTDEQKAEVGNYDVLVAAEKALTELLEAEIAEALKRAEEAQKAAEDAQKAAEEAKAKAEEAQRKAEEAAASGAEDKAAAEKAAAEAEEAQKAAEDAQKAAEDAQKAAELAKSAAEAHNKEAAASAAAAAASAKEMAETYLKVVEIKAELIQALAEAQAAAEKAEAEAKAAEEARLAAEKAALDAARYAALYELAILQKDADALTGHSKVEYQQIVDAAKADIAAAASADAVKEILAAAKAKLEAVNCPSEAFADVLDGAWYHDGIDYMVAHGYMNGVSKSEFEVDGTLTRAQLVTILYRIAGTPDVSGTNPFEDVAAGQWYTDAIIWAAEAGVVNGTSKTTFEPDTAITREQIAVILYRYTKAEPVAEDLLKEFSDAATVSTYAVEAMNWALSEGLINGVDENGETTLQPVATATRAQIAVILNRYLEK